MNTPFENECSSIMAVEQVYEKFYPILVRLAGKLLGGNVFVQDVVQDVFVGVCQQELYFVSEAAMLNYLYSSTYNKSIDFLRRKQLQYRYEEIYTEKMKTKSVATPTDLLDKELLTLVEDRVAGLPPKCQQIFLLKYKEERSNPEIGEHLQLSVKTVENQVFIARNVLRKYVYAYLCS